MPLLLFVAAMLLAGSAHAADRITVIVDAFGDRADVAHDWGYSVLVEIGGKRILFDAGNNAELFERNVSALKIDLSRLDAVVISHRHGDHTAGLRLIRRLNPSVKIYVPADEHFGGPTPQAYFRAESTLPPAMRYFGGAAPATVPHGSAWGDMAFVRIRAAAEILPGVRLVPVVSNTPGTRDLQELTLVVDTSSGQIVVAGCSHPGIETVLEAVTEMDGSVRLLVGGIHLVTAPVEDVTRVAEALRGRWNVQSIAPGHCTGEIAFGRMRAMFGDRHVYAGAGTTIELGPR